MNWRARLQLSWLNRFRHAPPFVLAFAFKLKILILSYNAMHIQKYHAFCLSCFVNPQIDAHLGNDWFASMGTIREAVAVQSMLCFQRLKKFMSNRNLLTGQKQLHQVFVFLSKKLIYIDFELEKQDLESSSSEASSGTSTLPWLCATTSESPCVMQSATIRLE